jgi:hypothetical protein
MSWNAKPPIFTLLDSALKLQIKLTQLAALQRVQALQSILPPGSTLPVVAPLISPTPPKAP